MPTPFLGVGFPPAAPSLRPREQTRMVIAGKVGLQLRQGLGGIGEVRGMHHHHPIELGGQLHAPELDAREPADGLTRPLPVPLPVPFDEENGLMEAPLGLREAGAETAIIETRGEVRYRLPLDAEEAMFVDE